MNLKAIQPKNETEELLLSMTEIRETILKKTHRKPEETLEFKLFQTKKNISFQTTYIY